MNDDSACLEMLFRKDTDDFQARIPMAQAAGYRRFEFWGWKNRDIPAIEAAAAANGMTVTGFLAEPKCHIIDPSEWDKFLSGLEESIKVAQRLKAPFLYIQGGDPVAGQSRAEQIASMVICLQKAADILRGSGVTLLVEPVSDSEGCFLDHGAEGLDIIALVDRPEVRLLYDVYHSYVMGEDFKTAIGDRMSLIGHVHLADFPGRGAPGTGTLDLPAIKRWFRDQGYTGYFGLEYKD